LQEKKKRTTRALQKRACGVGHTETVADRGRIFFFFFSSAAHYRNMSVAPTIRRPSPTVGVRTAIAKYDRRSIGAKDMFL
jgi:hypothetical protein